MLHVIAVLVGLVLLSLPSAAQPKRVALVIGNSAYVNTPKLANPKNDTADISVALVALGFKVVEGRDLDKPGFDRKIRDFAVALSGAEVGVFFYAGHGLQVNGHNYLAPVDAQLSTASALDFEMVRLDLIHRTMEREAQTNVIFLDACRDNPLARNLARAMGTRSVEIGRGLAAVESGVGTLISFSTQPGNVALDGGGRNSPYAAALLKHVSSKQDLSAILISVRNDVMRETQGKQVPWEHSALRARFFFSPPETQRVAKAAAPPVPHSTTLYESLMRRILARKLGGKINPNDEGKDNHYMSIKELKALAACIEWEKSTPIRLEYRGFAFSHSTSTQADADERALSSCYRITNGCQCTIVDRNGDNALTFPPAWTEKHRGALQGK
jgi:Caspase domain